MGTPKRRQKNCMDECRLGQVKTWSNVTALAKIRILINGAGDEAGYLRDGLGV